MMGQLPLLIRITIALFFFAVTVGSWTLVVALINTRPRIASEKIEYDRTPMVGFAILALELLTTLLWMTFQSPFSSTVLLFAILPAMCGLWFLVRHAKGRKAILASAICLMIMVGSALLGTSTVLLWPYNIPVLLRPLVSLLQNPQKLHPSAPLETQQIIVINNQKVSFDQISKSLLPTREGRLTSLTLNNSTLVFSAGSEEIKLTLGTLKLSSQSALITNGRPLTIEAKQILSENSEIRSFDPESLTPPPNPIRGGRGVNGLNGGILTLRTETMPVNNLSIKLFGQNGGKGGDGLAGSPGAPGRNGERATDSLFGCANGGGDGAPGTDGSIGGTGGNGGDGGSGGTLTVFKFSRESRRIDPDLPGGLPNLRGGLAGTGGAGGPGGPGGPGGQGGSGSAFCRGGHGGPPGKTGLTGSWGLDGAPGKIGHVVFMNGNVSSRSPQPQGYN